MVVYSSVAGASIGALFLGGVVPGILIGLGQMFVIFMGNKKYHYPKQDPMSFKDFLKLAIKCQFIFKHSLSLNCFANNLKYEVKLFREI